MQHIQEMSFGYSSFSDNTRRSGSVTGTDHRWFCEVISSVFFFCSRFRCHPGMLHFSFHVLFEFCFSGGLVSCLYEDCFEFVIGH